MKLIKLIKSNCIKKTSIRLLFAFLIRLHLRMAGHLSNRLLFAMDLDYVTVEIDHPFVILYIKNRIINIKQN
jgi:hypothetical protein